MDKVLQDTSRRDGILKNGFDKILNEMIEIGTYDSHQVTPKV